jgi:hypothetical protein
MTIAAHGWGGDRGDFLTGISLLILPHPHPQLAANFADHRQPWWWR